MQVEEEYKKPKSQDRVVGGKIPQMWGQSLFVIGRLVKEGFLFPGEIDPLNRRQGTGSRPDIVVQGKAVNRYRVVQLIAADWCTKSLQDNAVKHYIG